jgi:hypothetical protein
MSEEFQQQALPMQSNTDSHYDGVAQQWLWDW